MIYQDARDTEEEVLDRLTVDWMMGQLTNEEQDILRMWVVEDMSFEEIGEVVGNKYYGTALPETKIRYRKDKILTMLRKKRVEAGL